MLRHEVDGTYKRIVLIYDHLLDPRLIWAMGDDPFELAALTPDEIAEREQSFVDGLARRADDQPRSMFEYGMLHRHKARLRAGLAVSAFELTRQSHWAIGGSPFWAEGRTFIVR